MRTRSLLAPLVVLLFATALVAPAAEAEVTHVLITKRANVLSGQSFGSVGAYEKLVGKIFFALDPENVWNLGIVDLARAPRNAEGLVEFSADLFILRPVDASRGNGVVFFDVVNRGGLGLLSRFNFAEGSSDPTTEAELGDGFLMRQGYTIVAVGWEAMPNEPALALDPPIASDNGEPITGVIRNWFIPVEAGPTFELTSAYWTGVRAYPPLDPGDPDYTLMERVGYWGASRLLPRESWQFGRPGETPIDPHYLTLYTGFKAGSTYELAYETKDPHVAGVGFAAIRDAASYFKYDPDAILPATYAYATGSSQTGRFLRVMLHEGFTIDEQGRVALDAIWVNMGGASLGSFNERFAQPNVGGFHSEARFPFLYQTTQDPATGRVDGLGARIPEGLHPKVFLVETSSEYWDRGRVVALTHTSQDGREDLKEADNVRIYHLAGLPHSASRFPPTWPISQPVRGNSVDRAPAHRALLVALDRWVREGREPPPSQHPTLSDGTLIPQDAVRFPDVPGIQWPYDVPGGYRSDLASPPLENPLPFLVPAVDVDGNEVAGLRLPEILVPLGTYTGWGFRSEAIGAPSEILAMVGSYVPFARTRAEREQRGDPRRSIEERYTSRADYLQRVERATRTLIGEGYILEEDLRRVVDRAAEHWDWLMSTSSSN